MRTNLLFVCSGNVDRSPTAEAILRMMTEIRDKIIVLNIPDRFPYGSPKLVRLLIRRLRSNGITVPYAAWDVFLEKEMREDILEKRRNIQGKCECGATIVLAYDGEKVCQNCGKVYGRKHVQKTIDRIHLPSSYWSGSQDNQEKQLESDVERRGWG